MYCLEKPIVSYILIEYFRIHLMMLAPLLELIFIA